MGKLRNSDCDDKVLNFPTIKKKQKHWMKKKEPMKITYISSPTLVKAASASEFRALVQELTGKDSRVGEEENYDYYSPVTSGGSGGSGSSVEENYDQVACTSGVDELDYSDYFVVAPEDGYLSNSTGDVVTAAAVEETASYSTMEMEEGGFSLWRDVPDGFGNVGGLNQYSLNCVFV